MIRNKLEFKKNSQRLFCINKRWPLCFHLRETLHPSVDIIP